MMAVALTLGRLGATDRDLHPFDTFTRMTPLTQEDVDYADIAALDSWPAPESGIEVGAMPASEVRAALGITGYADARLHFVEGDVMHTVPDRAPSEIALLRLDTDWYETTRHELVHIYPRLVACRILIVDDNVHFRGATRATDEYFAGEPVYLSRIDYSARLVVKPRG
jgi:O-methyltransferase